MVWLEAGPQFSLVFGWSSIIFGLQGCPFSNILAGESKCLLDFSTSIGVSSLPAHSFPSLDMYEAKETQGTHQRTAFQVPGYTGGLLSSLYFSESYVCLIYNVQPYLLGEIGQSSFSENTIYVKILNVKMFLIHFIWGVEVTSSNFQRDFRFQKCAKSQEYRYRLVTLATQKVKMGTSLTPLGYVSSRPAQEIQQFPVSKKLIIIQFKLKEGQS